MKHGRFQQEVPGRDLLFFILEGVLPFASPSRWRRWFHQVMGMRDGQIRFFGLVSILLGLSILLLQ